LGLHNPERCGGVKQHKKKKSGDTDFSDSLANVVQIKDVAQARNNLLCRILQEVHDMIMATVESYRREHTLLARLLLVAPSPNEELLSSALLKAQAGGTK
jgi:hypothetical protein